MNTRSTSMTVLLGAFGCILPGLFAFGGCTSETDTSGGGGTTTTTTSHTNTGGTSAGGGGGTGGTNVGGSGGTNVGGGGGTNTGGGGAGGGAPAELCTSTGGTVSTTSCCLSTGDFPDSCGTGPCGCSPDNSHDVASCACPGNQCFDPVQGCIAPL
jgi:hypothetical protein